MIKLLNGIDISHHNKNMKNTAAINNFDFVIMKASEGATFRDSALKLYDIALDTKTLRGYYHFARPENGNSPRGEALNFIYAITEYLDKKPLLALDVEAGALNYKDLDNWCYEWARIVYEYTGVKPLIYCSESETYRFKKVADFGCGLWVAKWSNNKPSKISPWKFWAIWQYSDRGNISAVRTDMNYFNGTREQFIKYCEVVNNGESGGDSDNTRNRSAIPKRGSRKTTPDK